MNEDKKPIRYIRWHIELSAGYYDYDNTDTPTFVKDLLFAPMFSEAAISDMLFRYFHIEKGFRCVTILKCDRVGSVECII